MGSGERRCGGAGARPGPGAERVERSICAAPSGERNRESDRRKEVAAASARIPPVRRRIRRQTRGAGAGSRSRRCRPVRQPLLPRQAHEGPEARAPLGALQRRGRGVAGAAGVARLAAPHRRRSAEAGCGAAAALAPRAAYAQTPATARRRAACRRWSTRRKPSFSAIAFCSCSSSGSTNSITRPVSTSIR